MQDKQRRQLLLLAGLVAVLAAVIYIVWPAGAPSPSSNTARSQRKQGTSGAGTTGSLDVRLEDLKQPPAPPGEGARNPFRFYVKPPPPPPPPPQIPKPGDKNYVAPAPPPHVPGPGEEGYQPPPPPPIPLKFIGVMQQGNVKVAVFSDGSGSNKPAIYGAEGQLVLGQYRVVKIGVESVTMEYADGRGRQVIPLRG
jgi:hypothetical protein